MAQPGGTAPGSNAPAHSGSKTGYVRIGKISTFEQQRRVHAYCKGVDGAVAKIQTRFGVDALTVTAKCLERESGKVHVVWNNPRLSIRARKSSRS